MTPLSSADLIGTAQAQRVLLSAPDHATPEAWMTAVDDALKPLFGAEKALITLALPGHYTYHVDLSEAALASYFDHYAAIDEAGAMVAAIPLPFSTEETRQSEAHARFLRGETYNDLYIPSGFTRSLSLVAYGRVGPAPPGYVCYPSDLVGTILMCGSPMAQGRASGRAQTMLALLQPAFDASVRLLQSACLRAQAVSTVVDGLGVAAWLFDAAGACIHESEEAAGLLDRLAEGDVLRAAAQQSARQALAARRFGRPFTPSWTLAVDGLALTVTSAFVDVDERPAVIVRVEGAPPVYPEAGALRARFGLTPQEARVAVMRAEALTPAEVADRLCVSVHTVRRHTERVMEKLGVHRAADIGPVLLGRLVRRT